MPISGRYRLLISTPLPAGAPIIGVDLDPSITSLEFHKDVAGGDQALAVGYDTARGGKPLFDRRATRQIVDAQIDGFNDVQLYTGIEPCWGGRISMAETTGDLLTGMQAIGYGLTAGTDGVYFAPTSTPANNVLMTSGALLQQALPTAAPLLRIGDQTQFSDPGVQHMPSEMHMKSGQQIIDQLLQEATTAGSVVDYLVRDNRTIYLIPRIQPDFVNILPTYMAEFSQETPLKRVFNEVVGTVYVSYTDVTTGIKPDTPIGPFTDPTFAARYPGLTRTKVLSAGVMSEEGATAYGLAYLSIFSKPVITTTITLRPGQGLARFSGGYDDPEMIQPGTWIQLGEPAEIGSPQYVPPLIIVRLSFTAERKIATLELGARSPSETNLLQEIRRSIGSVKSGLNPNSRAGIP